ncbi:hypothetical protein G7Y89_g13767 [Cudoniella acicularis]|uniref:GmrSD restriction endonucleases N-terminal domain-containing protein n=1 Tax=Cudoniella acicularis TaxID=354080 RepID=A0A8H4VXX2_9HELO|nr:hypothetical protein G7Y89_g13767 [Cudoniella acicularis]
MSAVEILLAEKNTFQPAMEASNISTPPEDKTEPKIEIEIKDDPDPEPIQIPASRNPARYATAPARIKKEEPNADDGKVDTSIPEARNVEDMFDDVDGPEIVDLTYEGIAEINGVDHFVCEDFKIPQIPKPQIVTRPLQSLNDNIESGHIILDPDYQREVVWDEGRASLLITSILMGYFIPPIIFNVKSKVIERDGQRITTYIRICVDGKQRLTSVNKFMNGQIGFFDSNSPQKKWYFCHPIFEGRGGYSNHNILPNAVKAHFLKQSFCCYEYTELKLDTEETMFQLVQRGIALTPAEKMRAMSTEWATFTKQYEDDYTLIVNLSKQTRASGFRLVLTIFTMVQEVMWGKRKRSAAPTLQASPQSLLKVLEDKVPIADALKLRYKSIFDRYENLVKMSSTQVTATRFKVNPNSVFDPAPDFLRSPGVEHVRTFSPLELIATAILVAINMDSRNDQELLEDVKAMRYYLRIKHKDLRVNAQCWVTVWGYVTEEMERRKQTQGFLPLSVYNGVGLVGRPGLYMSPYGPAIVGSPTPTGSAFNGESSNINGNAGGKVGASVGADNGDSSSALSTPAPSSPELSSEEEMTDSSTDENSDNEDELTKKKPAAKAVNGKGKGKGKAKQNGTTTKNSKSSAKPDRNGTVKGKQTPPKRKTRNSRPVIEVKASKKRTSISKSAATPPAKRAKSRA